MTFSVCLRSLVSRSLGQDSPALRSLARRFALLSLLAISCAATAQPSKDNIPAETSSVTHHEITLKGQPIQYTATAGNLLIRDDRDDRPNASLFYVAYTQKNVDSRVRPVTFLYNGGPGSASLWLHMGSVGPVRVVTESPSPTGPAPFRWVDNESSLLDKSDLVFIDAPLCGFSRLVGKGTVRDFAGVDQDIKAFEKFIIRYITLNQRWNSPKFLFGESYGTPRSAGLVAALENDGIEFNGVILLSSLLNYNIRQPGYDLESLGYLPSYAAIAWQFNKVPHTGAMEEFVESARRFTRTEYYQALSQGDRISAAELETVAEKLSSFTGLTPAYLKGTHLRITPARFRKELLREQSVTLGRYDARFLGWDADEAGETAGSDPSDTAITGAYVGAFHDYLQRELKYTSPDTYRVAAPGVISMWDWHHRPAGGHGEETQPDTAIDLADAMRKNPRLRVFSANGWFDLATPFFATEWDLNHMSLPQPLVSNVEFGYYPAGHMIYLNVDALRQFRGDLERFYSVAGTTSAYMNYFKEIQGETSSAR